MFLSKALEFSQKGEKTPSCILPSSDGAVGSLFHGGYKGVMNADFLGKERVTHVVNTAKGLEIFGPKYLVYNECLRVTVVVGFMVPP